MKHPTSPCRPECEGRKLYCRRDCENWKFYESQLADFYAERLSDSQLMGDIVGMTTDSIKRGKQGAYTRNFFERRRGGK